MTASSSLASFVVEHDTWGIFSESAPTHPLEQAAPHLPENVRAVGELVHVPGLRGSLSFQRATLKSVFGVTDHLVVFAVSPFPREHLPEAVRLLSKHRQGAILSLIVEYRVGRSKVLLPDRASEPRGVAAAVAHSNVVGSWDETHPLVVELNGVCFEVAADHRDGAWHLAVGP